MHNDLKLTSLRFSRRNQTLLWYLFKTFSISSFFGTLTQRRTFFFWKMLIFFSFCCYLWVDMWNVTTTKKNDGVVFFSFFFEKFSSVFEGRINMNFSCCSSVINEIINSKTFKATHLFFEKFRFKAGVFWNHLQRVWHVQVVNWLVVSEQNRAF